MHVPTLLLTLSSISLPILTTALHTATLHHIPSTPNPTQKPSLLAILTYDPLHPHLSTLRSFTPPENTTDADADAITQVGIFMPAGDEASVKDGRLRTSATATRAFHKPFAGRFLLTVDADGGVVGARWGAWMPGSKSEGPMLKGKGKNAGKGGEDGNRNENGKGDFDITVMARPPVLVFDKAEKGRGKVAGEQGMGKDGEEEVVEKTFLQK